MGENNFGKMPMALYGFILLMAAIAYFILQTRIIKNHGKDSILSKAIGKDIKGKISPALYIIGLASSWMSPWIPGLIYALVALIWLIPDKRIEYIIDNQREDI
jgi:uncharacterized membrane protein